MKLYSFALILVATSLAPSAYGKDRCPGHKWQGRDSLSAVVRKKVDGDTLGVEIEGRNYFVRFLGVDTPETHFQDQSQGYWAEEAARYLGDWVNEGDSVKIELDVERCDAYDRILGFVWRGDQMLNRDLVDSGLAVNYCIFPNLKYCKDFSQRVKKAIFGRKGMFSDQQTEIPYDWRRSVTRQNPTKYVGSLTTLLVFPPNQQDQVEVWDRVFFFNRDAIRPPYHLAD